MADSKYVNVLKVEVAPELQDFFYSDIAMQTYRDLHPVEAGQIGSFTMLATDEDIEKLKREPRVLSIQDAFTMHAVPHETLLSDAVATAFTPQFSFPGVFIEDRCVRFHELEQVYGMGIRGDGLTIGVADAGLREADINDIGDRLLGYKNFTSASEHADTQLHGAWCTRAALMPRSRVIHARVLDEGGSGSGSWLTEGLSWLYSQDVDAVVVSIGGPTEVVDMWENVIHAGRAKGIPTFVAAGNAGCGTDFKGNVESPGNCPSSFALAAVNPDDGTIAYFSCCGPEIWSAWAGYQIFVKGIQRAFSGTSMTPWAAGQTYLAAKQFSGKPMEEIILAMQRAAIDRVDVAPRNEGNGIGQALATIKQFMDTPEPVPTPSGPELVPYMTPWEFYRKKGYLKEAMIKDKQGNIAHSIPVEKASK